MLRWSVYADHQSLRGLGWGVHVGGKSSAAGSGVEWPEGPLHGQLILLLSTGSRSLTPDPDDQPPGVLMHQEPFCPVRASAPCRRSGVGQLSGPHGPCLEVLELRRASPEVARKAAVPSATPRTCS